jgi:hypothetical protein
MRGPPSNVWEVYLVMGKRLSSLVRNRGSEEAVKVAS